MYGGRYAQVFVARFFGYDGLNVVQCLVAIVPKFEDYLAKLVAIDAAVLVVIHKSGI